MNRDWRAGFSQFMIALFLGGVTVPGWESMVLAQQIIPDETLGAESSVVTPDTIKGIESDRISGGAARGNNLFHSFREFNIGEGRGGYFENPAVIENIFSRVTGSNPSEILGTLGVLGNANLFFLNPNGILFGPNASLDLNGSFLGTTADNILFPDGKQFSATNPDVPPLLTVNVQQPIGLEFQGKGTIARIENRSTAPAGEDLSGESLSGLRVLDGQSLLLVGGDVAIDGGGLHALNGRVELAGAANDGTVGLSVDENNLSLSFPEELARADISLTNEAFVSTSGKGGGEIQVWGRRVKLSEGSQIAANTLGLEAGGGLTVNATESVQLIGTSAGGQPPGRESGVEGEIGEITRLINLYQLLTTPSSGLFAETEGIGEGGELTISTPALLVQDGAIVSAVTLGSGEAGNLTVTATESVQLIGASAINKLKSGLYTIAFGSGKAGDLTISAGQLLISDGAWANTGTLGSGAGGNLTVTATESVQLIGTSPIDPLTRGLFVPVFEIEDPENLASAQFPGGLFTSTLGSGVGGNLTIRTGQLLVRDGALAITGTIGSSGDGGNLTVAATESVQLIGPSLGTTTEDVREGRFFSGLSTTTDLGTGEAGYLRINTPTLLVQEEGLIIADTFTSGAGGSITVKANTFEATNGGRLFTRTSSSEDAGNITLKVQDRITLAGAGSGLFANTEASSTGDGGSIFIDPTTMMIRDGAQVAVNSSGSGRGGDIDLQTGSLTLDKGTITAETASNQGGDINLTISNLLTLSNNSQITATASTDEAGGNGGNIRIDAPFIIAFPNEDSNIQANAFEGNGGNVTINTNGIFGIEFRDQQTPLSDITASSEFGQQGEVEINTSAVDPTRGLNNLPQEAVETEVAQSCQETGSQSTLEFFDIGRGGLPPTPEDLFSSEVVIAEWIPLDLAEDQTLDEIFSESELMKITILKSPCHRR